MAKKKQRSPKAPGSQSSCTIMIHSSENENLFRGSNAQADLLERFFNAASNGEKETVSNMVSLFTSVSIDERNEHGWSALMLAARNGHSNVVQHLLEQGADPLLTNKAGQTALEIASFWNHGSVMTTLNRFLKPATLPQLEFVNHFGLNSVDRQSYKRKDVGYIENLKSLPSSQYIVFANMELLVTRQNVRSRVSVLYLSQESLSAALEKIPADVIYVGKGSLLEKKIDAVTEAESSDSAAYFAVNFREMPDEEILPVKSLGGEFSGKSFAISLMMLPHHQAGVVAQARSILAWHERYKFCPTCGNKTEMAESGYKRTCCNKECDSHKGIHNTCFPRIDPVVIVLVISTDGKSCLLGRQKRFPPRMYSCLAGFMEPGESIEDAARREVLEESGVKVGKLDYYSSQPWPFPAQLMIGMIGQAASDTIVVDQEELEDAKWFSRADVAEALAGGFDKPEGLIVPPKYAIAHQLQKAWVKMTANL